MNARARSQKSQAQFVSASAAWDAGDLPKAFELFSKAAELGDSGSQLNLGYFFDRGLSVKRDKTLALYWYHKAYRQDDACAAANIATLHKEGGRTAKMIWWLRRAIAMGNHDLLLDLGRCYERGTGVTTDNRRAQQYYQRLLESEQVTDFSREQAARRVSKLLR